MTGCTQLQCMASCGMGGSNAQSGDSPGISPGVPCRRMLGSLWQGILQRPHACMPCMCSRCATRPPHNSQRAGAPAGSLPGLVAVTVVPVDIGRAFHFGVPRGINLRRVGATDSAALLRRMLVRPGAACAFCVGWSCASRAAPPTRRFRAGARAGQRRPQPRLTSVRPRLQPPFDLRDGPARSPKANPGENLRGRPAPRAALQGWPTARTEAEGRVLRRGTAVAGCSSGPRVRSSRTRLGHAYTPQVRRRGSRRGSRRRPTPHGAPASATLTLVLGGHQSVGAQFEVVYYSTAGCWHYRNHVCVCVHTYAHANVTHLYLHQRVHRMRTTKRNCPVCEGFLHVRHGVIPYAPPGTT